MTVKLTLMTALGAGVLIAGAAIADSHGRGHGGPGGPGGMGPRAGAMQMLRAADLNGDNTIERAEVESLQAEMFAWLDRTGDGQLDISDRSPVEQRMAALRADDVDPERRARRAERRGDANGDGVISADEFGLRALERFDRIDADSDGAVTPAELDAMVAARDDRRYWWRSDEE